MWPTLLLIGSILLGQTDAVADDEAQVQVRRLVGQLGAPQLARREAAEEELLRMGPAVLKWLPEVTDRTSAEVKQRLTRIRQKLQQAETEAATRASLITLQADSLPLSKVLAAIEQQSGNKIIDFRERFGHEVTDPSLKVDFHETPFWQALDEVLRQAKLTVYFFGEERAVHIVGQGEEALPDPGRVSYSGPFRFEPTEIVARRNLRQPDAGTLLLTLSVAWEPRLRPIRLTQPMNEFSGTDENGRPILPSSLRTTLEVPVGEATSVDLTLPLELPPREVTRIAQLKGRLSAMIPGKIETFTFDKLIKAKNVSQRVAGVRVTLEQVRENNSIWEVRVRVRYDQPGEALESHRVWIFNNEAYLEDPDGKPIEYNLLETTGQSEQGIGVAYLFALDGPPIGHKFVYKTSSTIRTTTVEYEIKDLPLP